MSEEKLEKCSAGHPEQTYHFKGSEEEYLEFDPYNHKDGMGNPLQVFYNKDGAWIYAHNPEGWNESSVEITFCPWCGKNLSKKDDIQ